MHFKATQGLSTVRLPVLMLLFLLGLTGCLQPRVGFQGQLTDADGNVLPDGDYEMTVSFWDNDEGGNELFSQTVTVSVVDGLFNTDITDFPPHIFSGGVAATEDTLYMEVEIEGETLTPRRKVPGAPYAHALVAGSGIVGSRQDADTITDEGFDSALTVINTEVPGNNPGYGITALAGNAALYADNRAGDGTFGISTSGEDNPDVILGGYYASDASGTTAPDFDGGAGVIASDPALDFADIYLRSGDELVFHKNHNGSDTIATSSLAVYDGDGSDLQMRLDPDGDLSIDGVYSNGGADYAELIAVEGDEANYEPGDVVVVSAQQDRAVALTDTPYDSRVIGVYSAAPGFLGGAGTPEEQQAREEAILAAAGIENADGLRPAERSALLLANDGAIEVAIAGIVPVKVSAENGAIQRGDLLTTASLPGYAMKATDLVPGTILGKAMGSLESGTGVIEVLILIQ